jgi:hypothetical protein
MYNYIFEDDKFEYEKGVPSSQWLAVKYKIQEFSGINVRIAKLMKLQKCFFIEDMYIFQTIWCLGHKMNTNGSIGSTSTDASVVITVVYMVSSVEFIIQSLALVTKEGS